MGKEKLTDKQTQILEYIRHEILAKGYPPSIREICQAVDLKSTSSVHAQLSSLEAKGYIRRDLTKSRSIEIIDDDFSLTKRELVNIPIVGTVSCGQPILAEQNIEDYFPVPPEYIHNTNNQTFMLRVKGDSMINVGIYEKDLVIVEQCSSARNGEIVVALIEDLATVKTFYKENGYIRLQPENDYMDPIIVEHCEILGRVIGLFRNFI
ncbi:transcriptional repressor LexA [Clostridium sp. AF15-41]|uniref:transcriptional repressor LexA n=1 Tax=Clostridium sp. AF15-41 TaxID=2292996 RepID=UPI000E71C5E7|nr:transcriptional repressor LexA [Clostridium sp. AF15-41]RJW98632.1 transcriptional repressor LexA [Clostridium sp. AF15-41]